jgi:hypothetical protein
MDWDAVEALWERGFAELAVDAKEHPILLGDSPTLRESDREKMAELLFETYNIPACVQRLSSHSPYLSLSLARSCLAIRSPSIWSPALSSPRFVLQSHRKKSRNLNLFSTPHLFL